MAKLFFQWNGEMKLVKISPETHERLRIYSWKIGISLEQAADLIHERFGEISEELILQYLNRFDP